MKIAELISVVATTGLNQHHHTSELQTVDREAERFQIHCLLRFTPAFSDRFPS